MLTRRSLDGVDLCGGAGHRFVVYEPAWWQVWRWIYLVFTRRPRGFTTITQPDRPALRVRVLGEPVVPRALYSR